MLRDASVHGSSDEGDYRYRMVFDNSEGGVLFVGGWCSGFLQEFFLYFLFGFFPAERYSYVLCFFSILCSQSVIL